MNTTLIKAVIVVTFALVFYSIAVIIEQKKRSVTKNVLTFLTAGVVFDISSTALMIIGSRRIPITVHGFIGYSALTVMIIEAVLIWRSWKRNGSDRVSRNLNIYTKIAYIWWVAAYVAGAIIAMIIKT
jgi:EamA domain-containing membrane protein RarD